jgi:polar amino acid transport system permease protein
MYHWDWNWVWSYRGQLIAALGVTLLLNAIVLVVGTIVGTGVGLMSRARSPVVRFIYRAYVDLFRTLPILVLLVWFFFCAPILLGGIRISSFLSAVIVLSLNLSAFIAEIVRAGIDAVPKKQIEAGVTAGFSRAQITRFIIMPLALRIMVPPLVGQYINSVKLSVLASVIAVPELLSRTTDIISQVYRPFEFYTVLALIFLVILLPGTLWSRRLESRTSQPRSSSR